MTQGQAAIRSTVSLLLAGLVLSGCMALPQPVTRAETAPDTLAASPAAKAQAKSVLIEDLQARRSVLASSSAIGAVARAVEASNAGSAAAELRVAQLRAEARSKNWLPSIGPSVSLNALGALATSILVEVAILDNGKRKAEREFAAADVEVAAAKLSADTNRRVQQGLTLYINAEAARGRAAAAERALMRLDEFERIMSLRVQGGISNFSEQATMNAKVADMRAKLADDRSAESQAMAELSALAARDMGDVRGLSDIPSLNRSQTPLAVMQAQAEHDRTLAELRVERAGHMPGLSVGGNVLGGLGGIGVKVGPENGWSPGRGTQLEAIEAAGVASERRVAQVREDSARRLAALEQKYEGLGAQIARHSDLVTQMRQSLDLYERQYKAGQRGLLDLVGQFESLARMERDLVDMRHERARVRVEAARDLGALAEGGRI